MTRFGSSQGDDRNNTLRPPVLRTWTCNTFRHSKLINRGIDPVYHRHRCIFEGVCGTSLAQTAGTLTQARTRTKAYCIALNQHRYQEPLSSTSQKLYGHRAVELCNKGSFAISPARNPRIAGAKIAPTIHGPGICLLAQSRHIVTTDNQPTLTPNLLHSYNLYKRSHLPSASAP